MLFLLRDLQILKFFFISLAFYNKNIYNNKVSVLDNAKVAQLVARRIRNAQVEGSRPFFG